MRQGAASAGRPECEGPEAGKLLEVVQHIYEAAIRPDPWPRIMSAIAPLMGTPKAMFIRVDRTHPRDSVTEVIGLEPHFATALRIRGLDQDKVWLAALSLPAGRVFRTTELMPLDALHRGPLYEKIAAPAGVEFAVCGMIENGPEFFSNISFMRAATDFDDSHKEILGALLPHLQLALRLSGRIAAADAGRREVLVSFDRARQPVAVLDRSGYAIHTNDFATRVLQNADGIKLKFGRFLFDSVTTQAEFERAVRMSVASIGRDIPAARHEIRVTRRSAGSPYMLAIIPLSGTADRALLPDGAACLILIHDLERVSELPLERLAWMYRLTPAEVRICEAIYQFGSVDSTASRLSLARNTVRSHLKGIYGKFGVINQGQLMQRLANSMSMSDGHNRERRGAS